MKYETNISQLKFILILIFGIINFKLKSQILISENGIKDSITNKIFRIQSKVFHGVKYGELQFLSSPLKPYFTKINNNKKENYFIYFDSVILKETDFVGLSFQFNKKFDYKTFNSKQDLTTVDFLYNFEINGIKLTGTYFNINLEDLSKVITEKEFNFLKLLAAALSQNPYPIVEDTIYYLHGEKTVGGINLISSNSFINSEVNLFKKSTANGHSYSVDLDTFYLKYICNIIFNYIDYNQYIDNPVVFFEDFNLINIAEIYRYSMLFSEKTKLNYIDEKNNQLVLRDTIIMEELHCYNVSKLEVNKDYCKLEFKFIEYKYPENSKFKTLNPKILTYFIHRKEFKKFIGEFQYDLIQEIYEIE